MQSSFNSLFRHDYNNECYICTGDYDLAGFAVGAVERASILPRSDIVPGDVLLGLPSSGLHSNGFSLVRKVVALAGLTYSSPCPWQPHTKTTTLTLGEALLEPTKIYVKSLLPVVRAGLIKGMAHITGGGLTENVPRILPKGLGATVDRRTWASPAVFRMMQRLGEIPDAEMFRAFNMGVGLVIIAPPNLQAQMSELLKPYANLQAWELGRVEPNSTGILYTGT